jgi:dipeptidase E
MSPKQQIISIGGGGFTARNTNFAMEKYLIAQTGKKNPKVCFLPQASSEDKAYVAKFFEVFLSLGAKPSWLSLFSPVKTADLDKLLEQDLIYVGGGNTKSMLALWQTWGVDQLLKKAYQQGTVLSGISAGAICWFDQCITDSVSPLGHLDGLGWLQGSCCPHFDSEPDRRPTYLTMIKNKLCKPGIALQDHSAAHFIDGKLNCIVAAKPSAKGFYIEPNNETPLPAVELMP